MKLIASVDSTQNLNKIIAKIDGALINVPKFSLLYQEIDIFKCLDILNKNNKIAILSLNKMLFEEDLEPFKEQIIKYKDTNCLFYVTDMGAVNILDDLNLINRCIYDPTTMICNYLDANEYLNLGLDCVGISLEIPLDDAKMIAKKCHNVLIHGFTRRIMMQSKRKLVSLYLEKINKENKYYNKVLSLKEETRDDIYKMIENENGTLIYRSYFSSLLENIASLNDFKYVLLDSSLIDFDNFELLLELIEGYKNGELTEDDIKLRIKFIDINIEDGFKYKDSVYQKEELKSE